MSASIPSNLLDKKEPHRFDRKEDPTSYVYSGRRFYTVTQEGRKFSCHERAGRCFLGALVVGGTLGAALYFSQVKNLFVKKQEDSTTKLVDEALEDSKPDAPEIRDLLDLQNPSETEKNQIKEAFIQTVLNGQNANLILQAIAQHEIPLSQEEEWIKKAYTNDCTFSDEEFTQLKQEQLKTKIYYVANAHAKLAFISRLKSLGMYEQPLFCPGPAIIAANMDIVSARDAIKSFLESLRRDKVLLTKEEFDKSDMVKYIDQIDRILGLRFMERLIKENNLQHIKVPKTYVVINDDVQSLSFYITVDIAQIGFNLELRPASKDPQFLIRAERITSDYKKLSLETAIELMTILEKTGYNDFGGQNIIFNNDDIYFVDTEYANFNPLEPDFAAILSIRDLLKDPKDNEAFMKAYVERIEKFKKEKGIRENNIEAYYTAFNNPYKNLANAYQHRPFTFNVDELTQQFENLKIEASNKT